MDPDIVIRTSETGWLKALALAYRDKKHVLVVDDAKVGIDPDQDSLLEMGRKAHLSARDIVAACLATGMGAFGAAMIVMAFLDPEPTSKLTLLIASGALLTATGGWTAIHILTRHKPPGIKLGRNGIEITWPDA